MADSTVVTGDRGVFGLTPATAAPASPLRVQGAPARAAAAPVVSLDANGDLRVGAIVEADIPSAFTRRDTAQTIGSWWTWSAGNLIVFDAGVLQPPQATARSTGTRIIIEPVAGGPEFSIGRETGALWTDVPATAEHRWYQGNVCRLRLATDGGLYVENGNGVLWLTNSGGGHGGVAAGGNLNLWAGMIGGSGTIELQSGTAGASGLIQPAVNYRENLGQLGRKFLSLHAAELWVETLVAQQTMATIGGRVLVGPTTTLTRDVAPADTLIFVKHNSLKLHVAGVEYGSKLVLEAAGKREVFAVISTTTPTADPTRGDYGYSVIRGFVNGSTTTTPWQWFAGDAVFDTGKLASPSGAFIDLYSVQGVNPGSTAGPTIVGNVRTGANYNDWIEHWAVGNLRGIYSNGTADVMGAAFGRPDQMHIQIDATNGIRMMGSANVYTYGHWRMNGDIMIGYAGASMLSFISAEGSLNLQVNGAYKMRLLNDGQMYLATGLVVGSGGASAIVRSSLAYDWNSGSGFCFWANADGTIVHALIGNSTGRRITWDGAALKIVSDGFTLDEQGLLFAQSGGSLEPGKTIRWGTTGIQVWDTTSGYGEIFRPSGSLNLNARNGALVLQGGGSSIDRTTLTIYPTAMTFGGVITGGSRPAFYPTEHNVCDFGRSDLYWRNAWFGGIATIGGVQAISWVAIGNPATAGSYLLALNADSAAKPTSSTWTIASGRSVKRDERDVDPVDALDRIRRVPVKRFTFNGDAGTIDGAAGIGPVADDVRDVLPESVRDVDGTLMFNAHELFMLNVAAVQALAARLDELSPPKGPTP